VEVPARTFRKDGFEIEGGNNVNMAIKGLRATRKRKSFREEVYESLRRSILHGDLKPGERLIEEQIARQIGISRTPVREAFHKLEQEELVVRLPKKGFAVREFTQADVEEIFGIRAALESYAASLATLHIPTERIEALERNLGETKRAMEEGDYDRVIRLHTDFHNMLYKACKSKKLLDMINNYSDYFYRYRPALVHSDSGFQSSLEDHHEMLEAMKKRDPHRVERLVRKHLERGKKIILKEIEEGRLVP
jgi:DNA-binding GntR family transcriptional regulator